MCAVRGTVDVLAVDSKRYVGAQIGVHDLRGVRVGTVSHLRNVEYLVVSGERADVERVAGAGRDALAGGRGGAVPGGGCDGPGVGGPGRLDTRGHGTSAARGAAGDRASSATAGRTGPRAPGRAEAVTDGAQ